MVDTMFTWREQIENEFRRQDELNAQAALTGTSPRST